QHAVKKSFTPKKPADISQKSTETSLIEYFLYPKLGPGHMWETVAKIVEKRGGKVEKNRLVTKDYAKKGKVIAVDVLDTETKKTTKVTGDYFFSTMPINELIAAFDGVEVPKKVRYIAENLPYRDFITVGLLMKRLKIKNETNRKTKYKIGRAHV